MPNARIINQMSRVGVRELIGLVALSGMVSTADAKTHLIPTRDFEPALHAALATSEPGDEIVLPEGTFPILRGLHLGVREVSVRGQGSARTRLDFSQQAKGAQSWLVMANGVSIMGLRLIDPPSDGLVVRGARGIDIEDVAVEWTGPPRSSNGGYGIYPVNSTDVRVENCYARGASEAGIYVGQSFRGVVRGNTVEENVSGLDIENSTEILVEKNTVRRNSIGIVVSARPGLLQPRSVEIVVARNEVSRNNLESFAHPGTILSELRQGIGLAVVGGIRTRVRRNEFGDHRGTQMLFLSYSSLSADLRRDPYFRPDLDGTELSRNRFLRSDHAPSSGTQNWRNAEGFDVVWDGVITSVPTRPEKTPTPLCRNEQSADRFFNGARSQEQSSFDASVPKCDRNRSSAPSP